MKKLLQGFFVLLFLFIVSDTIAQDRVVTGTVTAQEDGLPIPGVSVKVKGSTTGTSTGPDGKFSISVTGANPILTFSFIGYTTQEVPVPQSNMINVSLRTDAQQLGEVVVTAFGIARSRNQVPYAAQQVTGEEVSKTRTNNFVQNLSGKVAGLDIKQTNSLGGSTNVVLRGTKSITGDNQALFVIDGVPFNN
ncbi:MAG TPA: carboxypeptidase-like regulatory domain-containing protein, partial [Sphingobacteriaceae bacterium]